MSRVTKFAARETGPTERVAGFLAHLRLNGLRLGVSETDTALKALGHIALFDPEEARLALKAVCAGSKDEARAFDELFDAYWLNGGRVSFRLAPSAQANQTDTRTTAKSDAFEASGSGAPSTPEGADGGETESDGEGRLIASDTRNLLKKDLRDVVDSDDIAEALRVAERIGAALRDRRSRRRRAQRKGPEIDFRRVARKSLATGGEPIHLPRRARPDRPVRITALCDVSGSMIAYARPFLAFLIGLMRNDPACDAYLFHTRLVRITEALRDPDPFRSLNRLTLLSEGFGGGSRIGGNLTEFTRYYAKSFVDGRSVVFILSDGYDTDGGNNVGAALQTLKRRGCRIVWLNPLKGWKEYAPIADGMAGAMPHLDGFFAANTLGALEALASEFERI